MRLFKALFIFGFLGFVLWGCGGGGGSGGGTSVTPSGGIIAVAGQSGSNVTIKVGGTKGAAPSGSTVQATDLNTKVTLTTTAAADGSFDPTFTGNTGDMFEVVVSQNGTTIIDTTIGVTVISKAVMTNLAQLGSFPTQIEIHGNRAYVVNGGSDNVQIFDLNQDPPQQVGTIVLPPGSDPVAIAFLDDTRAYIANNIGQSVAQVNVVTGQCELLIVRSDHVPSDSSVCNQVRTVDINSFEDPFSIALANGKVYVTNSNLDKSFQPAGNGFVTVIDTKTNLVINTIQLLEENAQGITVVGNRVYAVSGGSSVFDSNSGLVTPTSKGAVGVIDSATDKLVASISIALNPALPLVGFPNKLEPTPDGKFGYIGSGTAGVLFKVNLEDNTLVRGADNPIIVTSAQVQDATFDVEIRDDGLGFIAVFNTDLIVTFDTATDTTNPFPFIAPFPAGQKANDPNSQFFEGIQDIAVRHGKTGTDFQGADIFFITGISQELGSINTALVLPSQ